MSYLHATVPASTTSELAPVHQPGEPTAATLSRAIVAHLAPQAWIPQLGWETNGVTAAARITLAAAGARVPTVLSWRAGQFTLSIDGRRDPLRHSGLAHRADHLATLVSDITMSTVEHLEEQHVAERLAATIAYAGIYAAGERAGADRDLLPYQCAQCGDADFTAAAGGPTHLEDHRCPVCRGTAPQPEPPVPAPARRQPRRRRPRPVQEALLDTQAVPASKNQPHSGPLADWPQHRLLQQITRNRFAIWRGDLYELVADGRNHRAVRPDPRDAELISQLRRAGLVCVGLWLFADVDGDSRETHRLDLTRDGWRVLRRWRALC
ncbi:hypothetical protein NQK81_01265 [Amycolatopsis roodepoortensis]|uniref:hypothetical protein n=1 Tax=Amycolatopsis roodepoortensis TaxID=700274 RepID=UPI00214BD6B5|nr:hypothetical protein [Amycolatopsis roodepoortensis]UUV32104.1 hypothetical protein NQK81_01265 [Amycolatopsis roodepoortensis]